MNMGFELSKEMGLSFLHHFFFYYLKNQLIQC